MIAAPASSDVKPFLKWAGGKRQLLPEILKYVPRDIERYYEPFIGGGALLFALSPHRAVVGDSNAELINCYRVIRDSVDGLIEALKDHRNDKDYFYQVRRWDRDKSYFQRSEVERAARVVFLNKTCYNGLYRVNQRGEFNAPFGRYKNPRILDEQALRSISCFLNSSDSEILCSDFSDTVKTATSRDFIYFDPPYDPVSQTASFTGYSLGGFDRLEQERLKQVIDSLSCKGCRVLLSNSDTEFIRGLYRSYRMIAVQASRAINSKGAKRGKVGELLIMNY